VIVVGDEKFRAQADKEEGNVVELSSPDLNASIVKLQKSQQLLLQALQAMYLMEQHGVETATPAQRLDDARAALENAMGSDEFRTWVALTM
jgi:hypothetical protein